VSTEWKDILEASGDATIGQAAVQLSIQRTRAVGADQLDIIRFFERTASDETLQAELKALLDTGDGDVSDIIPGSRSEKGEEG